MRVLFSSFRSVTSMRPIMLEKARLVYVLTHNRHSRKNIRALSALTKIRVSRFLPVSN